MQSVLQCPQSGLGPGSRLSHWGILPSDQHHHYPDEDIVVSHNLLSRPWVIARVWEALSDINILVVINVIFH